MQPERNIPSGGEQPPQRYSAICEPDWPLADLHSQQVRSSTGDSRTEDGAMEGVKGEFRGRCEKIDLQMWSEFGAKKSRSRMLLNLELGPSARTPGLKSETWATRHFRPVCPAFLSIGGLRFAISCSEKMFLEVERGGPTEVLRLRGSFRMPGRAWSRLRDCVAGILLAKSRRFRLCRRKHA
jgi:hypothetical protein